VRELGAALLLLELDKQEDDVRVKLEHDVGAELLLLKLDEEDDVGVELLLLTLDKEEDDVKVELRCGVEAELLLRELDEKDDVGEDLGRDIRAELPLLELDAEEDDVEGSLGATEDTSGWSLERMCERDGEGREKQERPGLTNFLEMYGPESLRYILNSGMAPLLTRKLTSEQSGSARKTKHYLSQFLQKNCQMR
jgi:hypothetical protein